MVMKVIKNIREVMRVRVCKKFPAAYHGSKSYYGN